MADEWVAVATVEELSENGRKLVEIDDTIEIAVFHVDGAYYAIDNSCPHAHFPLIRGHLRDNVIICPYHCWDFDLTTGDSPTFEGVYVLTYPTRVVGDRVEINLAGSGREPYRPTAERYRR